LLVTGARLLGGYPAQSDTPTEDLLLPGALGVQDSLPAPASNPVRRSQQFVLSVGSREQENCLLSLWELMGEGWRLDTQIIHRTRPATLKTLAPSAATPHPAYAKAFKLLGLGDLAPSAAIPSPGLRPPSPHGRGSNKLQFTLPSPPSGEEDEGLISLHGVRGIGSVVHKFG